MYCKNVVKLVIIIFSQLPRSQFLIDQIKKMRKVHNIFTLISQQIIISKLLLMDKKIISVVGPF